MATAISANVADIMKFFDDLGTLFSQQDTLVNYGGLGFEIQTVELVRTWFSPRSGLLATERQYAFSDLLDAFDKVRSFDIMLLLLVRGLCSGLVIPATLAGDYS